VLVFIGGESLLRLPAFPSKGEFIMALAPASAIAPPIQAPITSGPPTMFSLALTTTFAQFDTAAGGTACWGCLVQNSLFNDSSAAQTGVAYVRTGVTGTIVYEILSGGEVFVPCSNTNQIFLGTLAGTGFARITVFNASRTNG